MEDYRRAETIKSRLKAMYNNGTSAAELANIFHLGLGPVQRALGIYVPEPVPPPPTFWQKLTRGRRR